MLLFFPLKIPILENDKNIPSPQKDINLKTTFLGMTVNCIWWGRSSSGDLQSVEKLLIVITPRFTLVLVVFVWSSSVEKDSFSIGLYVKEKLPRKKTTKRHNYESY